MNNERSYALDDTQVVKIKRVLDLESVRDLFRRFAIWILELLLEGTRRWTRWMTTVAGTHANLISRR